jgi:TRAP-type transport system small permease protein
MYSRGLKLVEDWIIVPVLAALLAFVTAGVFLQVILRYGFNATFLWAEEMALFAFIWSVFLGAAVGVRRRIHLAFDFLPLVLQGRAAGLHSLLINLSILLVALLLIVEGWYFAQLNVHRFSPAIGISLFIPTLIIPVSGALMLLAVVPDLLADLHRIVLGPAA